MRINPLRIRQLAKAFCYQIITGSKEALAKEIVTANVEIPGVELAGFYDYTDFSSGIVMGKKEIVFISRLNEEEQKMCYKRMVEDGIPFIIIAEGMHCPDLLKEYAIKVDHVILEDSKKTIDVVGEVYGFINAKLTPQTLIHGTLVEVYGSGVLLKGDSGIGKSEIALELIKRGHRLVADDSVLAYRRNHHLYGKSPEHLKQLLEVRGLGLIDVYRIFGITAVSETSEINYIIELVDIKEISQDNRLLENLNYEEISGLKCPVVKLPVTSGRSLSILVEVAVMNLRNRTLGFNATKEFMDRFDKMTKGEIDDD